MTVEAGELVVRIVANGGNLGRTVQSEVSRATGSVTKLGRSLGLTFGGAAVVSGVTKTINLAKNFDLTMRQVGVQTGQVGDELDDMRQLALKMGQDTVYSAQDAGNAMLELAKGGLNAAQIKAGALETAMQLAAAGNIELADAASAVVNGMGAFNLKAGQASRVAVALAGAANASSADVSDMTQALAQASAQANATGMSIEETSAALAIFANNGVKGSDAGTSLKTMLQNLIPTTTTQMTTMQDLGLSFTKANGEFVSMEEVAGRLRKSLGGLSQAQRVQALRTLFGSDASRAALFLYEAGAKGVRKATKATKDQTTVQEMANTAMQGASGAWENFTGSVETAAIKVGTKALPALTDLLNWGSDMLASADEWGPVVVDSLDGVTDAAKALWPMLRDGAELVGDLAQWWAQLPDPIKSATMEAGLLAVALPRVAAGLSAVASTGARAIVTTRTLATTMGTVETRARLANAAVTGAGIVGGLALMADQSGKTGKAVDLVGGALTGAFVGGTIGSAIPGVGTAIGAVGGAAAGTAISAFKMAKATDDAKMALVQEKDAARQAATATGDYRSSLDQVTGAATKATRALILQNAETSGARDLVARLGVNTRDLIGAVLGNEGATSRMAKAWRENSDALNGNEQVELQTWLDRNTHAMALQSEQVRQNHRDLQTWNQALKGLPRDVRLKVKAIGTDITMAQLRKLKKQGDLNNRQVKTIINAVGTEAAIRKIDGVWVAMRNGRKIKADLDPFVASIVDAMNHSKRNADTGTVGVLKELQKIRGAKADLDLWVAGVKSGTADAKRAGSTGGTQTGAALKSGLLAGFAGTASALAAAAVSAVRSAVAAAKAAAKVKSPSRVWRDELGKQLPLGGALGINDTAPVMARAAAKATSDAHQAAVEELLGSKRLGKYVAESLVDGMVGSSDRVRNTAAHLADLVGDAYDARDTAREKRRDKLQSILHSKKANDLEKQRAKRELAQIKAAEHRDKVRERAIRKLINDQERASLKLARTWETNHAKLEDARQAVRDLQQQQADYAKSVADAMVAAADITADMPEGVAVTVQSITERMRKQVQQAQAFAANISGLIAAGLDQAYIDQLVQAGVAGGALEAAQLAGATPEEIAALNDLMQQLQSTGSTLGQQASDYLYGAGIREAQAFVTELEKQEDKIERMMRRQARAFARELRDAMEKLTDSQGGGKGGKGGKSGGNNAQRVVIPQQAPVISIGDIHNPVPETASQSVATRLRRLQQGGLLLPTTGAVSA